MLFAPSTIAISALILSFSILHMDCSEWLSSLPNFCLRFDKLTSPATAPDYRFYDIDCCLRNFKSINGVLSKSYLEHKSSRTSPTSVAAGPESPTPRASFQPIPRGSLKRKFDAVPEDGICAGNERRVSSKALFEAPPPAQPAARNLHESAFKGTALLNTIIPTVKRGDNYFVENNDITLRAVVCQTLSEQVPPSQLH